MRTATGDTPTAVNIVPYFNLEDAVHGNKGSVQLASGDTILLLHQDPLTAERSAKISCWDTKSGKRIKIALHCVAGGIGVFISGYFVTLALERNVNSILMQFLDGSSSFIFNVLPAFFFIKSIPSFFTKLADYGWTYRISAPLGLSLGTLSTAAAVKLGIDAIFKNQYAWVRALGWPVVGASLLNNEASRVIGGTELMNRVQIFLLQFFKHEWKNYEPLFTFLEDLKLYGPCLKNFTYQEGSTIPQIAELFYKELGRIGIEPIPRTGKAFLEAYRLGITGAAAYLTWALMPMWLYAAENGLNATSLLWGDGKLGSQHPIVTWLAGLASELFYLQYATRIYDYSIDLSLLYRREMSFKTKATLGVIGAATVVLGALYLASSYLSGSGMAKEGDDAFAARCRLEDNSTNMTCVSGNNTFYTSSGTFYDIAAAPANIIGGFWGYIAAIGAGNLVNGIATMDVARRFLNSGTKVGPDKDSDALGINDALDQLIGLIRSRKYEKLGATFEEQMAAVASINDARNAWSPEANLTVTGEIYKLFPICGRRKTGENQPLLTKSSQSKPPKSDIGGLQPVGEASDGSGDDLHVEAGPN